MQVWHQDQMDRAADSYSSYGSSADDSSAYSSIPTPQQYRTIYTPIWHESSNSWDGNL